MSENIWGGLTQTQINLLIKVTERRRRVDELLADAVKIIPGVSIDALRVEPTIALTGDLSELRVLMDRAESLGLQLCLAVKYDESDFPESLEAIVLEQTQTIIQLKSRLEQYEPLSQPEKHT